MAKALRLIEEIRKRFVRPPYTCLSQLALSFVLSNPDVTAAIPGAGSVQEMRENLSAAELPPMPAALAEELVAAARPLLALMRSRRKKNKKK
jgi:aryl-alcohol dehydrogenase-like predicted oxidoreductase